MRTVLSVSLPENMSEELDRFARNTGRKKSDIVKESLSLFLWEMKLRAVQKKLDPKAKKLGIVSEKDVFKAIPVRDIKKMRGYLKGIDKTVKREKDRG